MCHLGVISLTCALRRECAWLSVQLIFRAFRPGSPHDSVALPLSSRSSVDGAPVKSALACIVLPLFAAASHAAPSLPTFECDRSPLLVRDADIWSSGGVARHRDLLVVEGLIKSIGPTGHVKAPRGARVLN